MKLPKSNMPHEKEIAIELFMQTPDHFRCPYLAQDPIGFYCSKNLKHGEDISPARRASDTIYFN